jgi:hypothetical protein
MEDSRYTHLWQAVIRQQFADLKNKNRKEDGQILRAQAQLWLLEDRRDFPVVCELAGWHPDRVREYAQNVVAER